MSTSITPVLTSNDGTVMISAVNSGNIVTTSSTSLAPKMTVTQVTLDHQSAGSTASTTTMSITPTSYPPTLSLFTSSSSSVSTTTGSGSVTITNSSVSPANTNTLQNHPTPTFNPANNTILSSVNNTAAIAALAGSSINPSNTSSIQLNPPPIPSQQHQQQQQQQHHQQPVNPVVFLTKQRLQELVTEIDPKEQLDEEVEDTLLNIADDFIENLVTSACQLAKHRGSKTVDVNDVQLILEKNYNMLIPGFGSLPLFHQMRSCYKKSPASEAHKQRLALIKKTLKKF